jgi:hypothetical protein
MRSTFFLFCVEVIVTCLTAKTSALTISLQHLKAVPAEVAGVRS